MQSNGQPKAQKTQHFLFQPIDSWFFRESRSMDGAGSTALDSIFPPQNNTLMGAIRTQVGNAYHAKNGSDWKAFNAHHALANIIGYGNDYANLQAQGAWLYRDNALYFPCPMNVLEQGEVDNKTTDFFSIGEAIDCDLGKVKLPQLNRDKFQSPLEHAYISSAGFAQILAGKLPKHNDIVTRSDLLAKDPRLGIARDNKLHRTIDGMLYQTNHLRLADGWCIYLGVNGLSDEYTVKDTLARLGGEARMAAVNTIEAPALPEKPTSSDSADVVIYLATPLPDVVHDADLPMLPNDSFTRQDGDDTTWQGEILGQSVEIFSAITGKPERFGGWDMARHQSLPVRSFIPAGSCWYIRANGNAQAIIDALHGQYVTTCNDRALGYGQIFVGVAPTAK